MVLVQANAERHSITLELASTLPQLRIAADAAFIAQTLQPLLDNAIRHARSRVIINAERGETCVAVAIEDDGSGIASDNMDRIFETGVHTPGGSGSGLGLALSRRLARSIGGDVHATPADGGARLVVELPIVAHANAPLP